jgi:hypothetical protein
MNFPVKKRKSRTSHKIDKLQEWLSKRKGAAKMAKAKIDTLQLKWGCSRETAIYIRALENRVRHLQGACEDLGNSASEREASERFIVDRRGEPAVVIMSVEDFIKTVAPPPKWLEKAWASPKQRGLDKLTPQEIDAEIKAYRREKKK